MIFEWDANKAQINLEKHGVSFELATLIFEDIDRITVKDTRHDYGEERNIILGQVVGRVLVVVTTERDTTQTIRIISARKANKREGRRYDDR
ncbi:BrnT family toxin [Sulfitobacter mediterraneus]|uniref:BrnT family toxin n=1 Tax=Sulfitobacter mediterraneus TaxID=83219 RepID=UPI0024929A9E|nr:BrnT family toxin [Sulfitobacter mediterraneus]